MSSIQCARDSIQACLAHDAVCIFYYHESNCPRKCNTLLMIGFPHSVLNLCIMICKRAPKPLDGPLLAANKSLAAQNIAPQLLCICFAPICATGIFGQEMESVQFQV